jgi:LPPG:FO 2-phospho-L-lactate transferase
LGGPGWFKIGDKDLAYHHRRRQLLDMGHPLSQATRHLCTQLEVKVTVLPMSDEPIGTLVLTDEGSMPFQRYFVERRCDPAVRGFQFQGAASSSPAPGVLAALEQAALVIICPSNPWVSVDPILAVPGIQGALKETPVLAISPLIGGQALKGPAAKMYRELGIAPTAASVARHYQGLLTGFVLDEIDRDQAEEIGEMGLRVLVTDTIMKSRADRVQLAEDVLEFGIRITEVKA